MPPEFRFGYPLEEGAPFPEDLLWVAILLKSDGTRRIDRSIPMPGSSNYIFRVLRQNLEGEEAATGTDVGLIPTKITNATSAAMTASGRGGDTSIPGLLDHWLGFPDENGFCEFRQEPTTPGDYFYKFRGILGDHANRFLTEHNPANLRYTNTSDRRIEHIAHELSNVDRMRAGNVSALVRQNIGHLWERIHAFVKMDPEGDWQTERDALVVLVEEHFCAVCEGAGLSYRLMNDHPREDWKSWLDGGLRFTVDRDLNASPITGKLVSATVFRSDLDNFRNSLSHHGKGYSDDDYGGDGLAVRSGVVSTPSSNTVPIPETDTLERMALMSHWERQYRLFSTSGLTGLAQPIWRGWCWMNCAAILEGWRNPVVRGGITANMALTIARFSEAHVTLMRDRFISQPWDIPFTIIENVRAFRTIPGPDIYFVPRPGGVADVAAVNALADLVDPILGSLTIRPS